MNAIENIKAAAINYNREFPECVADVEVGTAEVRVTYGSKQGSRFITFTVTAGISHNGFIAAHDPIVHQVPHRDRRVAFSGCIRKHAERLGRKHAGRDVPVVVIGRGV